MKSKLLPLFRVASVTRIAAVSIAFSLHATANTWVGTTNVWNTGGAANWTSPTTWTSGDDAIFGAPGAGGLTLALTTVTAHNIDFNTTGYSLTGSTLTLNGSTPTITTAPSVSASISSQILGTAGLTKAGAGTLTLSSTTNSFSGGVNITGGTLAIAAATNLPSGNALTFSGGGTLSMSAGISLANNVTIASGQSGVIKALSGNSVLTGNYSGVAGALELNSDTAGRIDINSATGGALGSTVTWSDQTASGTSYMAMNNDNAQTFYKDVKLTFNDTGNATTTVYFGNNSNNKNYQFGALDGGTSTTTFTSENRTNTVTVNGVVNGNYSGTIANGTGGTILFVKNGSATQTLSGANTYTGTTTISASGGTLQFAKQTSLYNNNTGSWTKTNILVNSGGTLAINVGGTSGPGAGEFTAANVTTLLTNLTTTINNNGLMAGSAIGFDTTNAAGGTFTIADNIANSTGTGAGSLGVTKLGTNTLVLTGTSTYTGATTVSAGSLLVNGALGNTAVTVSGSATLGGTGTIGGTVSVGGTGKLSAGASIESLSSGSLSMTTGTTFVYEAANDTSTGADLMAVDGTLSLVGVTLGLDAPTLAALASGAFGINDKITLISYEYNGATEVTSGFTGYTDDTNYTFGSNQWTFNYNDLTAGNNYGTDAVLGGQNRFVTLTLVPEPNVAALLGGVGVLALMRRRRA